MQTIHQIVNPQTGQPIVALSLPEAEKAKKLAQEMTNATGMVFAVLKIETIHTTIALSPVGGQGVLKI